MQFIIRMLNLCNNELIDSLLFIYREIGGHVK